MIVRGDHVAGALLIGAGLLVFALSGDLPFGDLAFPGAGFLPKVIASLIIAMGALLALGAAQSEPFRSLGWDDLKHAAAVAAIAAVAIFLYARVGFVVALAAMLLALLVGVERKRFVPATIFTAVAVASGYFLFTFLRAPIPDGPWGF